jgi:Omp85 superfamily domain
MGEVMFRYERGLLGRSRWLFMLGVALALRGEAAETRKVVADPQYAAGGVHELFFGKDYRDLWTTPATFEVLDLASEAGGLSPVRRVGGQQTKGLALKGRDGRNYTFRGLEKDPSKLLIEDLKGTVVERLLQDQMAAQHPASEVIARVLLDAASVPCPGWRLVVMPDDPALGDFRKDFAGNVGVFAEYPSPVSETNPGFRGVTQIIDHLELYERLEAGYEERADVHALLRARLMDVFMGDWDRHRKQWRWAKFPGSELWQPIPEDRDQAFSRYEGIVLNRARGRDPRFQKLRREYAGISGLTYNGSEQDRRLLIGLTRDDFRDAAVSLQAALTNAVIEQAAQAMPAEWAALDGPRLVAALEARRDHLPQIAERFYLHINARADVYLTRLPERIEAVRSAAGLKLTVWPKDATADAAPAFVREFRPGETKELRVYALGGDDAATVTGGSGILLRIVGGPGNDSLDARGAGEARLSDSSGTNRVLGADEDSRVYSPPPPPKNAPWIPPRDWGRETWTMPWLSYGADLGVFVGGGVETRSFGFRKDPYANRHVVRAGYAFGRQSARVDYLGVYQRENRASSWGLHVYGSGVDVLRFYGLGNATTNSGNDDFFKVSADQALVLPSFTVPFGSAFRLSLGPVLKYTRTQEDENRYINVVKPYGTGDFGQAGAWLGLVADGRDSALFPRRGGLVAVRGSVFPAVWDVERTFGQLNGEARGYLSAGKVVTLAVRAGAKQVFGRYPFHEAAYLGSGGFETSALGYAADTLRGFRTGRFGGDAAVFGNVDLRLKLSRLRLVLPGTWGLVGSADTGRVWLDGETDDVWHSSVGGGLWFSFLNDRSVVSAGVQHSREDDLFYFKGGFGF